MQGEATRLADRDNVWKVIRAVETEGGYEIHIIRIKDRDNIRFLPGCVVELQVIA